MIASVVATLNEDAGRLPSTIGQLASSPQIELGPYSEISRKIPLTIDCQNRFDVEETTRMVQELSGVSFVDIVFVHFEEGDRLPESSRSPH